MLKFTKSPGPRSMKQDAHQKSMASTAVMAFVPMVCAYNEVLVR